MTTRWAVRLALPEGWEPFDAPGPWALRWRRRWEGGAVAAASLEVLRDEGAGPDDLVARLREPEDGLWREVEVDGTVAPPRVIASEVDLRHPTVRRSASVTWFPEDGACLQLRLVTSDLLVLGDLTEVVRVWADRVETEARA